MQVVPIVLESKVGLYKGSEFSTRFIQGSKDKPTLFQTAVSALSIRYKLIRLYTPRHNGRVERSHREDYNKIIPATAFISAMTLISS